MSNTNYQKPRGTVDFYGTKLVHLEQIENVMKQCARLFAYSEIRTPIFEHTELFIRSVGETSDIVNKEIYSFLDKGQRSISLRPEGTAGVIRAVNENKLLQKQNFPLRLFYYGPIFRYERPQSGRSRQFHQFGFEVLNTTSYYDDADVILLAHTILKKLNLKKYHLDINCIGSVQSRAKWIDALKVYFEKYKDQLSEISLLRLQSNPLRILDDKVDGQKDFVLNAPKIKEFLTSEEINNFEQLKKILNNFEIKFNVNESLVRGLDYYSDLVFEFVSELNELQGQSTICGGGRYNQLIKELNGIDAQAVGFAFGLERILIQYETENNLLEETKNEGVNYSFITLVNLLPEQKTLSLSLAYLLRSANFSVCYDAQVTKLDKGFKLAELNQSKYVIILANKELAQKAVLVKNQINMQQDVVLIDDLVNYFNNHKN